MTDTPDSILRAAAALIKKSKHTVVFTGAGISVESGIPPFRGPGGLWEQYDPVFIELQHFMKYPENSWQMIRKVFYDFMSTAKPNPAHIAIAELEKRGHVKSIITQNIDGLHQLAGSRTVHEFHGSTRNLLCLSCRKKYPREAISLERLPPKCPACGGLLKPDFVFLGEQISEKVHVLSNSEAEIADVMLVIGTTGEIMPAALLPHTAKSNGAVIIEINPVESSYTPQITDFFLREKSAAVLGRLLEKIIESPPCNGHQGLP
jgi:NAD-dependent deacetylase